LGSAPSFSYQIQSLVVFKIIFNFLLRQALVTTPDLAEYGLHAKSLGITLFLSCLSSSFYFQLLAMRFLSSVFAEAYGQSLCVIAFVFVGLEIFFHNVINRILYQFAQLIWKTNPNALVELHAVRRHYWFSFYCIRDL